MEGDCSVVVSPRPVPVFDNDGSFTQKRRAGTPYKEHKYPRAPVKVSTPVARAYRTPRPPSPVGPKQVSFKSNSEAEISLCSPHYDSSARKSYFEQCFRIQKKLGEGSFGEVYQVVSCDDGKKYAVKKSHQHFRGKSDRERKLVEVEKHEQLHHHPNCIKFYKAWEERQKLYIQMELCKMSLSEYALMHGPISEQKVWQMLVDSLKGLQHLHDHRLCHLDIKPANIFLGVDGRTCKLGDFGLCMSLDQGIGEAMEGDARYLAPEVMKHQFGQHADVFSLGVSMLELASDVELPSDGENWHLLRQGQIPPQLCQGLSGALVKVLSRMMHPDPCKRPGVADILADLSQLMPNLETVLPAAREVATTTTLSSEGPRGEVPGVLGGGVAFLQEESMSDDEEEDERQWQAESQTGHQTTPPFNNSWIKHSPISFPSPIYSGPPIPLNFESSDSSPERPYQSSPTKPRRTLVIEPKNLFDSFKETEEL